MSLWSRVVKFEKRSSKNVIVVEQQWLSYDSSLNRKVYSVCDAENFAPLYHYSSSSKTGVEAFDFRDGKIVGSDSVMNNTKKDFSIDQPNPTLNWELDLEIFPLLDLRTGKTFAINFYQPGYNNPPKEYMYRVVSEEKVSAGNNALIDCWILKINYERNNYALFWISKDKR